MSGRKTGIAQGALRVSQRSRNKKRALVRTFQRMRKFYPGSTFYVTLTANLVLRHLTQHTYQVFYGQSYGRARTVYYGQQVDDEGRLERLFHEFPVSSESEAHDLPTEWSVQDFQDLYRLRFANSNVVVHEVVSLVFFFSKGLEDYEAQRTLPVQPQIVSLFD